MEDAPKLLKTHKSECPDIWIRLPRHKWPKSWSSMEDPVVPLERNLYGHPLAGLLWERHFEKILLKYGWCERGEGVQGVLTLICSGVAQTCHDDRVVELKEQVVIEEVDGEGQEGKVKEEGRGRVKENAPWMVWR